MANNVSWIEFISDDNGKMAAFYSGLFGWKTQGYMPGYEVFMPDSGPSGAFREGYEPGTPQTVVYVDVDDIDAALAKVEELGGTVVVPKREISPEVGWSAFFKDPTGNIVGLHQNPPGHP